MLQRLDDGFDGRVGVGARADVGEHDADDVVGNACDARQAGARLGQVFGNHLRRGFEQAIGESGVEHALIGDVAADVNESDTHRVFAQRGHVERHAQGFFEAVAMRQHGAGALRIQAGVVGRDAFAQIAAHHEHAIEALHLEAHLQLEIAVLVALLRGFAGLENSAHRLQHVRGDGFGPQRVERAAGNGFFLGVEAAHRVTADARQDHAVTPHDQCEVGK